MPGWLKWLWGSGEERKLNSARVVKAIDHGSNVQLLCLDERGLLSVYLDPEPFSLFCRGLKRARVELVGALIGFDRDTIQVANLGRVFRRRNLPPRSISRK
jgi:hypothetical protein